MNQSRIRFPGEAEAEKAGYRTAGDCWQAARPLAKTGVPGSRKTAGRPEDELAQGVGFAPTAPGD